MRTAVHASLLLVGACAPATSSLPSDGAVVPLDPVALAASRVRHDGALPVRAPRDWTVRLADDGPSVDDPRTRAVLLARAHAFGGADSSVDRDASGWVVRLATPVEAFRVAFGEQLARTGRVEIASLAACPWLRAVQLPAGVRRGSEPVPPTKRAAPFLVVLPGLHARDARASLHALVGSLAPPAGVSLRLGSVRISASAGDVLRTWCVATRDSITDARVATARPTLDQRSLEPVLDVSLGEATRAALARLDPEGARVVSVDGEVIDVMAPTTIGAGWLALAPSATPSDGTVRIQPRSRAFDASPEVLATILPTGPLPHPLRLVAAARSGFLP